MAGPAEDFEEFYRVTYPAAYRTALAITRSPSLAEDGCQEAYVDAFRRRSSYRGDGSPEAWLHRILVHRAIDQLRRRPDVDQLNPDLDRPAGTPPDRDQDVLDAIGRLEERARAAIVLRYYVGYQVQEVAKILGTRPGAVSMLLERALGRLRTDIEEGRRRSDRGVPAAVSDEGRS